MRLGLLRLRSEHKQDEQHAADEDQIQWVSENLGKQAHHHALALTEMEANILSSQQTSRKPSQSQVYLNLNGFTDYLGSRLGTPFLPRQFKGDIHLSDSERLYPPLLHAAGLDPGAALKPMLLTAKQESVGLILGHLNGRDLERLRHLLQLILGA